MLRSETPTFSLNSLSVALGFALINLNVFCANSGISMGSLWEVYGMLFIDLFGNHFPLLFLCVEELLAWRSSRNTFVRNFILMEILSLY